MRKIADHLALITMTLWVGGLWAIGMAAATLFAALSDKQLAGMLAGKLFTNIALIGIACGFYLLIQRLASQGTQVFKQWFFWIVLAMLALTLIGHFGIQPIIHSLKLEGGTAAVMASVTASRFARWHGVASILYLLQSLLGLALILKQRP